MSTRTIREIAAGREHEVFAALGLNLDTRRTHIHCPIPDHDDRNPSFRWDNGKGRYYCSCSQGNVVELVKRVEGRTGTDAAKRVLEILGEITPQHETELEKRRRERRQSEARRAAQERARAREAAEMANDTRAIDIARCAAAEAVPASLSNVAGQYLLNRSIGRSAGVLFHPNPRAYTKDGKPKVLEPSALYVARDGNGDVAGVQAVQLDQSARKLATTIAKWTIGRPSRGYARFGPEGAKTVIIGEGGETTLSAFEAWPQARCLASLSALRFDLEDRDIAQADTIIALVERSPKGDIERKARKKIQELANKDRSKRWLIALPPEEFDPTNTKADANDVLQVAGVSMVEAMLIAAEPITPNKGTAALPEYYPRPSSDRDAVIAAQTKTIDRMSDEAVRRAICLREARVARKSAHDEIMGDMGLSPDGDVPETLAAKLKGRKAGASRKINAEVAAKHGFVKLPKERRVDLFTGGQGTGKTRAALKAEARQKANTITVYLAPTLGKAEEARADYAHPDIKAHRPHYAIRGRRALDDDGKTPMCPRYKAVDAAARAGVEVRSEICGSCSLASICGYLRQEREIEEMLDAGRGAVFFAAHNYLFLPIPSVKRADLVIVDEDISIKAADPIHFDPAMMTNHRFWESDNPSETANWIDKAKSVRDAIITSPDDIPGNLKKHEIGPDEIRGMRRKLYKTDGAPNVHGGMSDAAIIEKVDAYVIRGAGQINRTLRRLGIAMKSDLKKIPHIRHNPAKRLKVENEWEFLPRIELSDLKSLARWARKAAIIALDGTGNSNLNKAVFGDVMHHHFAVERQLDCTKVKGRSFSKSTVLHEKTGTNFQDQIRQYLDQQSGEKVFVASSAGIEKSLSLGERYVTAHYGALRGLNGFEDCYRSIVIGREQANVGAMEDIARCFIPDDGRDILSTAYLQGLDDDGEINDGLVEVTRRLRMRDPEAVEIETVRIHPDPLVQSVIEQMREAECVQAIDRTRPVFNERAADVLNSLVLDVTYDRIVEWKDARQEYRGGSRASEYLERAINAGVFLESPGERSRCNPDLWKTQKAAKNDGARYALEKGPKAYIDSIYGLGLFYLSVRYWTKPSQCKPFTAIIVDDGEDIQSRLEAVTGTVLRIEAEGLEPIGIASVETDPLTLPPPSSEDIGPPIDIPDPEPAVRIASKVRIDSREWPPDRYKFCVRDRTEKTVQSIDVKQNCSRAFSHARAYCSPSSELPRFSHKEWWY